MTIPDKTNIDSISFDKQKGFYYSYIESILHAFGCIACFYTDLKISISIIKTIKEITMTEETKEKDNFVLYVGLTAAVLVGVLLAVKSSENDKFAPIKAQLVEERNLMDIRVIKQDYE